MSRLLDLVSVVDRLRAPGGCPWDQAQTFATMRPYLVEECYEVLDALDKDDPSLIAEELGDLLFVVLFYVRMAEDLPHGAFGLEETADQIATKMVVRHPHVFGSAEHPLGAKDGIRVWEDRKAKPGPDGRPRSRLAGVPRSLPALLRTHRQGEKASTVGFDWPDAQGVLTKVREELTELEEALAQGTAAEVEHEYGDLLMAVGSLGRHIETTPEEALQGANNRFADRFQHMERAAFDRGTSLRDLDDAQLDALWEDAKAALRAGGS